MGPASGEAAEVEGQTANLKLTRWVTRSRVTPELLLLPQCPASDTYNVTPSLVNTLPQELIDIIIDYLPKHVCSS